MLTAERLRQLLDYDPETGIFRWRIARQGVRVGAAAGSLNGRGYRQTQIDGQLYPAHRLAWLYVYGEWPTIDIDHINGIQGDNRLANLRLATKSQNRANARRHKNNTSGYEGVYLDRRNGRFLAQIGFNGHRKYLGLFDTPELAHQAYCAAAQKYHGEFARAA
jgi:HNH endonuclease/AP2 domain